MGSDISFKNNVTHKVFIYQSYIYKKLDLALDNPQGFIGHKTVTYMY